MLTPRSRIKVIEIRHPKEHDHDRETYTKGLSDKY